MREVHEVGWVLGEKLKEIKEERLRRRKWKPPNKTEMLPVMSGHEHAI